MPRRAVPSYGATPAARLTAVTVAGFSSSAAMPVSRASRLVLSRRIAAWPILWLMPSWAALSVNVTPVFGVAGVTTVLVLAGGVAAGVAPVITTDVLIFPRGHDAVIDVAPREPGRQALLEGVGLAHGARGDALVDLQLAPC